MIVLFSRMCNVVVEGPWLTQEDDGLCYEEETEEGTLMWIALNFLFSEICYCWYFSSIGWLRMSRISTGMFCSSFSI